MRVGLSNGKKIGNTINDRLIAGFVLTECRARSCGNQLLVDIGCGTAPYAAIYDAFFKESVRLDIAPRTEIDFVATASATNLQADVADMVLLTEVLEHLPDPQLGLNEVSRILRPGGTLLLTVPFMHPLHEWPYDYFRFTEWGLRRLIENSGLKCVSIRRRGGLGLTALILLENFLSVAHELISRIPMLGALLGLPIRGVLRILLMLATNKKKQESILRSSQNASDEDLHGFGQLYAWTSGYFVKAVKLPIVSTSMNPISAANNSSTE